MIANRIRFAVIANENFGCTFAERNKEKECSMIHASDESMSRVKIEEGRGRGGGVRGGEIRTNRKGGGWRKGWLVSHAPRGRGENRFSLSAARIMARGEGAPSWKFDTLIRVFARYFKSGNISATA